MQLFENIDIKSNMMKYFHQDVKIDYNLMRDDARKIFQDYLNDQMTSIENLNDRNKMVSKLRLFGEVFFSLNSLFFEESKSYAENILPTLEAVDNIFEGNTTAGLLSLSLIDLPKFLSKYTNVHLRTMVKEDEDKKTPFRKHPAVVFFESLVVLLCLAKGKFDDGFLCDSVDSFLQKFWFFNPDIPGEKIQNELEGKVSQLEMTKLLKNRMNENQLKLLARTHNIMALVVMMTKNKRFKACELSVRIAEGKSTQGFKPGGDNNARVIRLTLLHRLLNDKKIEFMASLPSPLDSLESSKMKSMEKPPKKKDAKKSATTAKSAPACSHIAVIQSNQSRVELENQSPKKVTKPKTTKRKRTSDKKSSEGEDNLDMASQTQQFFFPFSASSPTELPLCDEIDDAIAQTVGDDDFTVDFRDSPFFSFSTSSSAESSVATLKIDEEDDTSSDDDSSRFEVDKYFPQSKLKSKQTENRHANDISDDKIAPFLLSSTDGISYCYQSSFFDY